MSNANYIVNKDEEAPVEDNAEPLEGTEVTDSVEDKYAGMSQDEIISMLEAKEKEAEHAQQALSRQGNELGENRKLIDKLLQAELRTTEPAKDTLDWDYEPEKAVKTLLDSEVGTLKNELQQIKTETALDKFKSQYPDFEKDSTSPEFMDWVQGSQYRSNLYNKNTEGFDPLSATELMSGWEERKTLLADKPSDDKREKDLKAASLERSAASGGSRKKTWSRAMIRDLRLNNEAEYLARKDEIMRAYDEGRVTK